MSFFSNQTLKVSGRLYEKGELEACIEFALKLHGSHKEVSDRQGSKQCIYKFEDKAFCIGVSKRDAVPTGWTAFPFAFNMKLMSDIVRANLEEQPVKENVADKGFMMSRYEGEGAAGNEIGVITFKPYSCTK